MRRDVTADSGPARSSSESSKPSPKQDEGAVCERWVRCGRSWCRCMNGGPRHGPYYARFWWRDGRRHKAYVRQADAPRAVAACADRREQERRARAEAEAHRQEWRRIRELIRELEHDRD
jgi:hypothetical protein